MSAFYRIQIEYVEILRISPHSVRMRGNRDQNNSGYGHFLRSIEASFQQKCKMVSKSLNEIGLKSISFNKDTYHNKIFVLIMY